MQEEILLEMLDMAIEQLSENTICSNCKIFRDRDHRCKDVDCCKSLLFDGLQAKAEKAIGEKLYYDTDADDDKMPRMKCLTLRY